MHQILIAVICFVAGIMVSIPIVTRLYFKIRTIGVLRLDRSDGVHMFLELEDSTKFKMVENKRYVIFRVLDESYVSKNNIEYNEERR